MSQLPSRAILLQILLIGILSVLLISFPILREASQALSETRVAVASGAYALAAEYLNQTVSFLPWRSDLLLKAGNLSLKAGHPESAILFLTQAAQSIPLPPDSLLDLGDAYLASGDSQLALQTWQQIPDSSGYAEMILQRLLELHVAQGDYDQLVDDYKYLIRLYPNQPDYYYQLGKLLAVLEPDTALAYLSQAAENDPTLASKVNELISRINTARLYDEAAYTSVSVGRWMGSVNEWQLAFLAFQQATVQRPDYAESWAYLGEALQHIRLDEKNTASQNGLKELQTSLELDSSSIVANTLMSIYWQRQGNDEKALEYLNQAVSQEPKNPYLQAELGRLTARMGDLPTAQLYYENAVAFASTEPLFWRLLAEFSLEKQIQVRQIALPAARSAVLLAPQDPQSLDLLGETLLSLGDILNAERFLRRAIALDESYSPAHLHLGMVYLSQGKNTLAQEEFAVAEHFADDPGILDQIDRLNSYFFP